MDTKILCLGALTMGAATGYEIRKICEEGPFAHFHASSFGSIYPALNKLLEEGLVVCTQHAQDGRPDKKVYALTEAGRAVFLEALSQPLAPDRRRSDYTFALFFGHMLEPGRVQELLDSYLKSFHTRAECIKGVDPSTFPPGQRFVFGFGQAMYHAAITYITSHRHLLEKEP